MICPRLYGVAPHQPGNAFRAATTASRASLREAFAAFARNSPEEECTTYDLPLSERGNATPMNSLYVFRTARRSVIEGSNLQRTRGTVGVAAPADPAPVGVPAAPHREPGVAMDARESDAAPAADQAAATGIITTQGTPPDRADHLRGRNPTPCTRRTATPGRTGCTCSTRPPRRGAGTPSTAGASPSPSTPQRRGRTACCSPSPPPRRGCGT